MQTNIRTSQRPEYEKFDFAKLQLVNRHGKVLKDNLAIFSATRVRYTAEAIATTLESIIKPGDRVAYVGKRGRAAIQAAPAAPTGIREAGGVPIAINWLRGERKPYVTDDREKRRNPEAPVIIVVESARELAVALRTFAAQHKKNRDKKPGEKPEWNFKKIIVTDNVELPERQPKALRGVIVPAKGEQVAVPASTRTPDPLARLTTHFAARRADWRPQGKERERQKEQRAPRDKKPELKEDDLGHLVIKEIPQTLSETVAPHARPRVTAVAQPATRQREERPMVHSDSWLEAVFSSSLRELTSAAAKSREPAREALALSLSTAA